MAEGQSPLNWQLESETEREEMQRYFVKRKHKLTVGSIIYRLSLQDER